MQKLATLAFGQVGPQQQKMENVLNNIAIKTSDHHTNTYNNRTTVLELILRVQAGNKIKEQCVSMECHDRQEIEIIIILENLMYGFYKPKFYAG